MYFAHMFIMPTAFGKPAHGWSGDASQGTAKTAALIASTTTNNHV